MTLPLLDEHTTTIAAPRSVVWDAVRHYAASMADSEHGLLGRVLGAAPASGFGLDDVSDGREVVLAGRHRFSRYRLVFVVDDSADGSTRLSIQSYAAFPGIRGRAYRGLLLGTRGHQFAVQRMMRSIRRRCE